MQTRFHRFFCQPPKHYLHHLPLKAQKEIREASKNYMIYYKHLTPIVYTSVKEYGVRLTIRYLCNPRTRRGSENALWQKILLAFQSEKDIQFAYPTTRFYTAGENKSTN